MKESRRHELIVWHLEQLDKLLKDEEKNYIKKDEGIIKGLVVMNLSHTRQMHFDEIVTIIIDKLHEKREDVDA